MHLNVVHWLKNVISLIREGMSIDEAAKKAIEFAKPRKSGTKRGAGTITSFYGADSVAASLDVSFFLWFVDKTIPFAAVDSEKLDDYLALTKRRAPPTRKLMLGALLEVVYEVMMKERQARLDGCLFAAGSTDAWTNRKLDKFVGFNLSWLDSDLQPHSEVVMIIPLNESHTWQNVTYAISKRLGNLLPPDAVLVTTTTDNGANFVKVSSSSKTLP